MLRQPEFLNFLIFELSRRTSTVAQPNLLYVAMSNVAQDVSYSYCTAVFRWSIYTPRDITKG